jgi:tetratricopeptide (TPR) repeat protein
MTQPNDISGTPVQPLLSDLFARYLQRQVSAHVAGLAAMDATGEVTPFDTAPVQPVDPRLAWDESVAVVRCFQPNIETKSLQAPTEWATLVVTHEPAAALAFAAGNFPQLVRQVHPLLQAAPLSALRPATGRAVHAPALLEWASQSVRLRQFPRTLLALGVLRLSRYFEQAAELLQQYRAQVPTSWQAAWANEEAALAWHRGQVDEALKLWEAQEDGMVVSFNRGMASLFLDRPAEAHPLLTRAVAQLPEDGAWHHLGRLYLALAEMRG